MATVHAYMFCNDKQYELFITSKATKLVFVVYRANRRISTKTFSLDTKLKNVYDWIISTIPGVEKCLTYFDLASLLRDLREKRGTATPC